MPGGWQKITRPLKLARPGAPAQDAQLLTDVHIQGGVNTLIWWSEGGDYSNLPMMEFPAARGTIISNLKLKGSTFNSSNRVAGSIGLWVRQPFDHDVNFLALFEIEKIAFEDHMVGAYVGEAAGPDMTSARFDLCLFRNCTAGSQIEGANVDNIIYDTCRFNGVEMERAIKTKYGKNYLFVSDSNPAPNEDPNDLYYKDPWNNFVRIDWTDSDMFPGGTAAWNNRISDGSKLRGEPGFDEATAKNIGGSSRVVVLNSNVSFPSDPGASTAYALEVEARSITVDGLRVEGVQSALLKVTQIPGNPNFANSRFFTTLRRCNFSNSTREPFDISNSTHNAGAPIVIEDCHFAEDNIPAPRADASGIITYSGLITTNDAILYSDGVVSSGGAQAKANILL